MLIYNKYNYKQVPKNISQQVVRPTRPQLTKKSKEFLKLLKLKVKPNVGNSKY